MGSKEKFMMLIAMFIYWQSLLKHSWIALVISIFVLLLGLVILPEYDRFEASKNDQDGGD